MTDDMTDLATLPGTHAHVWEALARGVTARDAPCRFAVLATVGDGGAARMVVLRDCDATAATVEVHSDLMADKVAELRAEPRATLLFWLPGDQLQIRLRARFDVVSGATVEARWQGIPNGPRRAYGGMPPPGCALATPSDHDDTPQRDRFAVLIGAVQQIETLHFGTPHRRAVFRRADGFAGGWIAP